MKINESCISCELCLPYCPMRAILVGDQGVYVEEDECVECNVCKRAEVCPVDAFEPQTDGLRAVRNAFSDPLVPHKTTSVPGRGTEEMKTNDVTGRFRPGHTGVALELGRPGTGTRFYDVEKVAMAVASVGVTFEPKNPVTFLMTDVRTGKIRDDVLNEKVLSAIVEFDIENNRLAAVLEQIKDVATRIDTVFSLDFIARVLPDNTAPQVAIARAAGFVPSLNGKTNVGLGRPLAKEA